MTSVRNRIRIAAVAAACAAVVLAGCRDSGPAGAVLAPTNARLDLLGTVDGLLARSGLLSCQALPEATASATIGPMGGRLDVGVNTLVIPAGALSAPVTITATAPSDRVSRVHFEPHGLTFRRPATLTMSYAHCSLLSRLLPSHIAYVDGDLTILYLLNGITNATHQTVTSGIGHFSDYALAW